MNHNPRNSKVSCCRFCRSSSKYQTVRANSVYGGKKEHKFYHCSKCDLVYLWPILSEEEEKKFYANEFEKFMEKRSGQDRDWSRPENHIRSNQDNVRRRMKFLEGYLVPGKSILEIGCSSGFMMDAFKKAGLSVSGIEPSGGFSNFLNERGHEFYYSLDELKRKKSDKTFDIIVHFFVLEHIRDTTSFIKEQLDLLKSDGIIIAEVPCVNDPLTSLYDIPAFEKFYWSIAHHYYFSPKSISNVLDKIKCKYELLPRQRYDLSNHLVWMQEGVPGGQGKYNHVFSEKTFNSYRQDLIDRWICDTFFLYIWKA